MSFLQLMLKSLLSIQLSCQHATILQKLFLEILSLNFFEIEVCLQAVVQLLLGRKELISNLNDRIVVPKAVGVPVQSEFIWNVALQVMLDIEHELFLD